MTERVQLPNDVVPSHYTLVLTPNLETLEFTCEEEINVEVVRSTCEITLHLREICVNSVNFKSTSVSVVPVCTDVKYNRARNTVKFVFEGTLPLGSGVLVVHFRGILNNDMAGFYKSSYTDASGNKKVMASTQFAPIDARRAFPCWDEPAMKATFSVTLIIPAHLSALSNMPEVSVTHLAGGKKRVLFDTSPKMSTYLLAWAVGEFDFVQGVTQNDVAIRVFSPPGRAEQGRFALEVGLRCLDFYDHFFQVPYPLPKLDMLCVTEFYFGATENWGLVTYREVSLMIDEAKASPQAKQRVAIVVCHELAHQWFGNLVTMSWWDSLWLSEGFAAFMEHFSVGDLIPEYRIWEQYTIDHFGSAQRLDALRSSHPIIVPIKHAEEVEQVFDAISYCKGSTVVNMVAAVLGRDKFREGLQLYMRRHAYGNAETGDLWAAWSEVSGRDIADLMSTWTTAMGYPYLTVVGEEWREGEVIVTLRQARFLSDGAAEDDDHLWKIPLLFATGGSESSDDAVIMDRKEQTFAIPFRGHPGSRPWVRINAGQKALARVVHSAEMIDRLLEAIGRGEVGAVDRAALLLDGFALAKAGLAPLETLVALLKALAASTLSLVGRQDCYTVANAIVSVLSALYVPMEQLGRSEVFDPFVAFGKGFVVAMVGKVGWEPREDESHTDKLLRVSVMGLLDTFAWNHPEVAAEARRRFDVHWTDPAVLPSEYKATVYKIVLMNGGVTEYEAILGTYRSTEDSQEKKYAIQSLGAAAGAALKRRTLDWAVKSGELKLQDFFYPMGAVSASAEGSELAWAYYRENLALLKDMVGRAFPALMDAVIVNCVGRFCTPDKAEEVEAFFRLHPLPSSQRRIDQCLENIRTAGKLFELVTRSKLVDPAFWQN